MESGLPRTPPHQITASPSSPPPIRKDRSWMPSHPDTPSYIARGIRAVPQPIQVVYPNRSVEIATEEHTIVEERSNYLGEPFDDGSNTSGKDATEKVNVDGGNIAASSFGNGATDTSVNPTVKDGNIKAGNIEGGNIEGGNIEGGNIEGGNIEDGNIEGGNNEVGNLEGGNIRAGAFDNGANNSSMDGTMQNANINGGNTTASGKGGRKNNKRSKRFQEMLENLVTPHPSAPVLVGCLSQNWEMKQKQILAEDARPTSPTPERVRTPLTDISWSTSEKETLVDTSDSETLDGMTPSPVLHDASHFPHYLRLRVYPSPRMPPSPSLVSTASASESESTSPSWNLLSTATNAGGNSETEEGGEKRKAERTRTSTPTKKAKTEDDDSDSEATPVRSRPSTALKMLPAEYRMCVIRRVKVEYSEDEQSQEDGEGDGEQ